jgi:hypothetical protein
LQALSKPSSTVLRSSVAIKMLPLPRCCDRLQVA